MSYVKQSERGMYWVSAGNLRCAGHADELTSLQHTGWYLDEFQEETARGVVYRLPHGRFVAGYDFSYDGDPGATLDFSATYDDAGEAARVADSLAENAAEREREYQEVSNARFRFGELAEDISRARRAALALIAEIKAHGRFTDGICAALRSRLEALREEIQEAREKRERLQSDYGRHSAWADA